MSGSQHNPNGRQSQLGSGWSPLQLQMANLLARAPQAHMASDRGVTWHTPTPPPHLYHVPAPSPPDPHQVMKSAGSNSVFRHTATPPELYRHTPTPPDKHLMRHTPSPGDVKSGPPIPPVDIYPHLGPGRGETTAHIPFTPHSDTRRAQRSYDDKLVRAEELLAYARVGVDLSLGSRANGAPPAPGPPVAPGGPIAPPAPPHSPALSVRDAPTINSLIARSGARRVDSLLERLAPAPAVAPAPASPHSVIVHSRAQPTPSPPSSNEDSADSFGAPPGSKRKRKPERTVRVPAPPAAPTPPASTVPPAPAPAPASAPPHSVQPPITTVATSASPAWVPSETTRVSPPAENGDAAHAELVGAGDTPPDPLAVGAVRSAPGETHSPRRKTRSGSAETIAEIAAMIALGAAGADPDGDTDAEDVLAPTRAPPALSVDKLKSVLASPDPAADPEPCAEPCPAPCPAPEPAPRVEVSSSPLHRDARERTPGGATAPRRADGRQVPVESPSEGKPAEGAACAEPAPAVVSFVEVENQLEKMFAGLEEEPRPSSASEATVKESAPANKRRKSAPGRGREAPPRRKGPRKKPNVKPRKKDPRDNKEGYDSGSNASSGRSRGPYIQIVGPRSSPVSVCVMNASRGEEEESSTRQPAAARGGERRRGLHASTLGLRYDAATRDPTWLCAFCQRAPHAARLGDLFGPYALDADLPEFRALDEASRRRLLAEGGRHEAWLHAPCALWAPGVVAAGARVWGLARAVWAALAERCRHCTRPGAPLACAARACSARAHLPCARTAAWHLDEADFRALCPAHTAAD